MRMHSRQGGGVASIVMQRAGGGKRGQEGAKTCMGSLKEGLKDLLKGLVPHTSYYG